VFVSRFTNLADSPGSARLTTDHDEAVTTRERASRVLAINNISDWAPLKWPGVNQAFLSSLIITLLLTYGVVLYGKRRKPGTPFSWGEAVLGSVYAFFLMFLAYGVVPHQWLTHVQNGLGWRADKPFYGWGNIFKAQSRPGGRFPFEINYLQIGDMLVVGIYVFMVGLQVKMWGWWQKRGAPKPTTEVAMSTYGRPLVRKA
jgi:hypothetical protein